MEGDATILVVAQAMLYVRHFAEPQLTWLEFMILSLVGTEGGHSITELAVITNIGLAEASKAVHRLELHGLLRARVLTTERRKKQVRLTKAGQAYLARVASAARVQPSAGDLFSRRSHASPLERRG